jgi:hypothetical protein
MIGRATFGVNPEDLVARARLTTIPRETWTLASRADPDAGSFAGEHRAEAAEERPF